LGVVVEVADVIDCWLYEVLPQREVLIVTYGAKRRDEGELRISDEHRRFGFFTLHEIETLPIPEGYRRSIRAWLARPDQHQ
jgi:catechol 2,3-dioxygenase-like lactoylglutathione lyase family enzyme